MRPTIRACFLPSTLTTHPKARAVQCVQIAVNPSSIVGGVTACWVDGAGCATLPPPHTADSDTEDQAPVDNDEQAKTTGNTTNDAKQHRRREGDQGWVERKAFI